MEARLASLSNLASGNNATDLVGTSNQVEICESELSLFICSFLLILMT